MHEEDIERGDRDSLEFRVARLRLEPGDALLVKMPMHGGNFSTKQALDTLHRLGVTAPVLFVAPDVEFTVVSGATGGPCPRCGSPSPGECKRHDCARKAFDVVGGQG